MGATNHTPTLKCLEARSLLLQVESVRTNCEIIAEQSQKHLDRLQFRAENLAGEAGFEAATRGASSKVPECIQAHKVLANAFSAEYTQVIDHQRFETLKSGYKTA